MDAVLYSVLTRLDGGLLEAGCSDMLGSHLKHCNVDGDGQSAQREINSWNEAIGDGVEPAEQPASQGAGNVAAMATATVAAVGPRLALSGDGRREVACTACWDARQHMQTDVRGLWPGLRPSAQV